MDANFEELHAAVEGDATDAEESFRAAVIGYHSQPDFHCRQPVYGRYFDLRYGAETSVEHCKPQVPFLILKSDGDPEVLWLDVRRVQSVHLLFAGKSDQLASRFGHVAIRLIVCPVEVETSEPCDVFLREHLVLGYQANVDELSLDLWKALTGGYRAYLYAHPFMDIYREYAISEFRDVYSLPLEMTAPRREALVRGLSELHWRFAGGYKFFTRNCGTLLQDALRVLWPAYAHEPALASTRMRPDSFFERLRSTSLVRSEALFELESAERNGYFFSSTKEYYEEAATVVVSALSEPTFHNLESFLDLLPETRKHLRERDGGFLKRLNSDSRLREAQLMIEEYAVLRSERELMAAIGHYMQEHGIEERIAALAGQITAEQWQILQECLVKPIRSRGKPPRSHEGIPQTLAAGEISTTTSLCSSESGRRSLRDLSGLIIEKDSDDYRRVRALFAYYNGSIDNVLALKGQ